MAELERKDLISDEALEAPKLLAGDLEKVVKNLDRIVKLGKSADFNIGSAKSFKEVRVESEKLTLSQKELAAQTRAIEKAQARLTPEYQKGQKTLTELRLSQQETTKSMKQQAVESSKLTTLYQKQSNRLNKLRADYKDLALQNKENTREGKALLQNITQLDSRLKSVDGKVGQYQRSVGNYAKAWGGVKNILSSAGVIGGLALVGQTLREGLNIIKNYTSANSTLNGILNKTRKETESLRKQQQLLGATTAFSATEVTKAQTELARLGLTMEQIEALTPSILNAAIAMGVDLAKASELVAGQLNAFGLAASEGKRVADVLTRATQISAFNFERLEVALGIVSPAAKSVNASIEETTAILSAAIDANIDASSAATALRNIYIDLTDQGITWDEAMKKINSSTDKLNAANELFGKRGAVVATVIAENTDKINENTIALNNAAGAAQSFADEQLNNLEGDIKLLTSAWEGFILSVEQGDGILAKALRGSVSFLTNAINGLTTVDTQFKLLFKDIEELEGKDVDNIINFGETEKGEKIIDVIKGITQSISDQKLSENKDFFAKEIVKALVLQGENFADAEVIAKRWAETVKLSVDNLKAQAVELAKNEDAVRNVKQAVSELREGKELQFLDISIFSEDDLKSDLDNRFNLISEHLKSVKDEEQRSYDDRLDALKKAQQERLQEIAENFVQASIDLYNNRVEARIQTLEVENEAYQESKNKELEYAEGNEDRQAAIREQAAKREEQTRKKVNQLRRRQAIADKALAITTTIINTIQSVQAALAPPPVGFGPVLGIPVAAGIAALGAVQVASIVSQPIPQFAKGTKSSPEGLAIVDEQGPELMKHNGKYFMANGDGAKLTYLKKGTQVFTAKETTDMLGNSAIHGISFVHKYEASNINGELLNEVKGLRKAMARQRGTSVNIYSNEKWNKIVREDYA